MRFLKFFTILSVAFALGGCNFVVLSPAGDVAAQQRDLIVISTAFMLVIVVPVMSLTVAFAWRYRQSDTRTAPYEPDWHHSTHLELLIWSAPLLIVICLGAITWIGTHLLDPYRKLNRISSERPIESRDQPLEIEVVALDWKWLFIYPAQGIASVNEFAAPVDRPLHFRLTASSLMNSFYIPALVGQIYAMPGMQTTLYAVANRSGSYRGFSANYSGAGFSGMHFKFEALDAGGFERWVASARATDAALGRTEYLQLERPSSNEPIRYYGSVDPRMFDAILNMCVETQKMCVSDIMAIDEAGGRRLTEMPDAESMVYDKSVRRGAATHLNIMH